MPPQRSVLVTAASISSLLWCHISGARPGWSPRQQECKWEHLTLIRSLAERFNFPEAAAGRHTLQATPALFTCCATQLACEEPLGAFTRRPTFKLSNRQCNRLTSSSYPPAVTPASSSRAESCRVDGLQPGSALQRSHSAARRSSHAATLISAACVNLAPATAFPASAAACSSQPRRQRQPR